MIHFLIVLVVIVTYSIKIVSFTLKHLILSAVNLSLMIVFNSQIYSVIERNDFFKPKVDLVYAGNQVPFQLAAKRFLFYLAFIDCIWQISNL